MRLLRSVIVILTSLMAMRFANGVELEQLSGAAHAYPAMRDLTGKKLANGEFTQEPRARSFISKSATT
jgi:hypothetical protein